uniref:Striatin interacting protein 2 n=1 Tax=Tetraodon nigroviridis TaxID=99883 RepID=H3DMF4_TETNG
MESPNLEFEYGDTDALTAELSELYSYTEEPEFALNRDYFEEDFRSHARSRRWSELPLEEQRAHVMRLLDALEVTDRDKRLKPSSTWLKGCLMSATRRPTSSTGPGTTSSCSTTWGSSPPCWSCSAWRSITTRPISLADSTELRVLLSIMYLMVETIRVRTQDDRPEWKAAREAFRSELASPSSNGEPFALLLFTMVTKFCSMNAPHFPMKKTVLVSPAGAASPWGGFEELQEMKVRSRRQLNLPPLPEDSIQSALLCHVTSPVGPVQSTTRLPSFAPQPLVKQDSLDTYNEQDPFKNDDARDEEEDPEDADSGIEGEPPPPPPPLRAPAERVSFPKGLPWAPKVREKDIEHFLETSRNKFIGFTLGSDVETLVGLPRPIHESVKTLKQHKYVSIAEVQIRREEELQQCPLTLVAEILYLGMLPNLSQFVIALLKLLLAAAPTSKAKTDSINILADVLPEEMPITVLQSMKLGIDVNRHKEIIVKAISALLLLLLKHFKLNHVYQFEIVSQHLVFANCIPLILKFFNQNIMSYISAKNSICVLDFPHCVVHEMPELTAESLEAGDSNQFCWRNPVLVYQSAENTEQADQVEALADHDARGV